MNPPIQPTVTPSCYQLPEDAYVLLVHTRDHLRLLGRLAAPRSRQDDLRGNELQIDPASLAHCFQQLCRQLDSCLEMTYWLRAQPFAD